MKLKYDTPDVDIIFFRVLEDKITTSEYGFDGEDIFASFLEH